MFEIVFGVSIYLRVINCWFYIYFMDILWVNLFDVKYNFFLLVCLMLIIFRLYYFYVFFWCYCRDKFLGINFFENILG